MTMELHILGSSSKGNCYIIQNGVEALIIEAGIRFIDVKKALDFNISKVVGCLITHRHGDHAKYAIDIVKSGIPTLALHDVIEAKKLKGSNVHEIKAGNGYKLGNFKVAVFPAKHDVPAVGFLIDHPAIGRLMFLTDSSDCDYAFPNLNHIMIECNYSDSILIDSIARGKTSKYQRLRLQDSHMELETCKRILTENDLKDVSNIILLHLSNNNSDEALFIRQIQRTTGKVVYAAKKDMKIILSKI